MRVLIESNLNPKEIVESIDEASQSRANWKEILGIKNVEIINIDKRKNLDYPSQRELKIFYIPQKSKLTIIVKEQKVERSISTAIINSLLIAIGEDIHVSIFNNSQTNPQIAVFKN